VVHTIVELRRRVDLARTIIPSTNLPFRVIGVPDGTDFADARLEVDDWSATFHVGLQYLPSDRWAIGVRYLHSASLGLNGDAHFEQIETGIPLPPGNPFGLPAGTPIDVLLAPQFSAGAPLSEQSLTTAITLPNQLTAGVRFIAAPALDLFFDYQWTGWKKFDEAVLRFAIAPEDTLLLDFQNASAFRWAAEYAARDALTLRGGVVYNTEATPDVTVTPLLPEAKRISFSIGLGYRISDRFRADGAFEAVLQKDRRGSVRLRENRNQSAAEQNVGQYSGGALLGGITLSYALGRRVTGVTTNR
jgi:long-chain fatty acid transport protein